MLGIVTKFMSKVNALNIFDNILRDAATMLAKIWYGLYFAIIRAIAWVLDMLTQLFFIFSGMTPVSSTELDADGVASKNDLVNFFLQEDTFVNAYIDLCIVALVLVVVFAIGKIVKQDYFDRSGPRSKGPIFRNIALSFIAFICVIPIFYFLMSAVSALALLVMDALGYEGGGVGSLLFEMSWEDGGTSIIKAANELGAGVPGLKQSDIYDKNNFGWYSRDTFYYYYWDPEGNIKEFAQGGMLKDGIQEFYWYLFIFGGLILISNLGQMLMAMVTRLYNLIALFIIAPSPISQIVLDDGAKFKQWKDKLLQEAFKVVGCVMSFMLFIMIMGIVTKLDLARYAFTTESASSVGLLESNDLTQELSNSISGMYYGGSDVAEAGMVDKFINALGKMIIILAGVGAIKDIDSVVTPLLVGGSSSMTMGETGKALSAAGKTAMGAAMAVGRAAVGGAVGLAGAAVSAGAGATLSAAKGINKGIDNGVGAFKDTFGAGKKADGEGEIPKSGGEGGNKDEKAQTPTEGTNNPGAASSAEVSKENEGVQVPEGENPVDPKEESSESGDGVQVPEGEKSVDSKEESSESGDGVQVPEGEKSVDPNEQSGEETQTSDSQNATKADDGVNNDSNKSQQQKTSISTENERQKVRFGTMNPQNVTVRRGVRKGKNLAKGALGVADGLYTGLRSAALHTAAGVGKSALKLGGKTAGTALKTGGSIAGILAKSTLQMTGLGSVADETSKFVGGVVSDVSKTVGSVGKDLKQQGSKFGKDMMKKKTDGKGNFVDKSGNSINAEGYRVDSNGKVMKDDEGNQIKGDSGPVMDSYLGTALATTGKIVKSAGSVAGKVVDFEVNRGGVLGFAARGVAAGIEKIPDHKDAVKGAVDDQFKTISQASGKIDSGKVSNSDASLYADDAITASQNMLDMAKTADQSSLDVTGVGNSELKVDENRVMEINSDSGTQYDDAMMAIASNDSKAIASTHNSDVTSYMNSNSGTSPISNAAQRAGYMGAIVQMSGALNAKYSDVIHSVEDAKKNGKKLDAKTISEYSNYLGEAKKLDQAYMYVEGGFAGGEESFKEMQRGLESSSAYKSKTADGAIEMSDRMATLSSSGAKKSASDYGARVRAYCSHSNKDFRHMSDRADNMFRKETVVDSKGNEMRGGNPNIKKRRAFTRYLKENADDLARYYGDVISEVDTAKKNGTQVSNETLSKYGEYLSQARKIDEAFMYATSGDGYAEGKASFDSLRGELEERYASGDKGKDWGEDHESVNERIAARANAMQELGTMASGRNSVGNDFDDRLHRTGIQTRAGNLGGLGDMAAGVIKTKKDKTRKTSAATYLAAATERTQKAKENYDRVRKETPNDAKAISEARKKLQDSVAAMQTYADRVGSETVKTHGKSVTQSKKNARLNKGNERYEQARDTVRTNIKKMKESGASAVDIAHAEEELARYEEEATRPGGTRGYENRNRVATRVKATVRTEKLAKKTAKTVTKAQSNQTQFAATKQSMASSSATDYIVDVEVDMDNNASYSSAIQTGVRSQALESIAAARMDYRAGNGSSDSFIRQVSNFNENIGINKDFVEAIKKVQKEQMPEGHNYKNVTEYRRDIRQRYENAVGTYNTNMQRAKDLAAEYASDPSSAKLEAVEAAIKNAVSASKVIGDIKVELKIDDKK